MREENGRAQKSPATAQPLPAGLSAFEFFLYSEPKNLRGRSGCFVPNPGPESYANYYVAKYYAGSSTLCQ